MAKEINNKDKQLERAIKNQKQKVRDNKKAGTTPKVYDLLKDYSTLNTKPPKGNPTGICSKCGEEFNQDLREDINAYSNWPTCKKCREQQAKSDKKIVQEEINKQIGRIKYTPFPAQQRIHDAFEDHRFVVIAAGNRFGKDRCSMMMGIKYFTECLSENRHIYNPSMVPTVMWWIVAPNEKFAMQNWRELKQYFPADWIVSYSDSSLAMQTIGGGLIEVRSGYDENALRGVGLDLCTLTEAAVFRDLDVAWTNLEARLDSQGRGRIKDRNGMDYGRGKAIINSSPVGRNFFYNMFCWGQENHIDYDPDWWSCQCPWTDNPANAASVAEVKHTKYGDFTREQRMIRRMGERLYRQNYMADFLADDTNVFREFENRCVINMFSPELNLSPEGRKDFKKQWETVIPGRTYVAGYDPATGSSGDNPWFVIRDTETNNVVRNFNLYGKSYDEQIGFIVMYCKMYNHATLNWLRTGHTALEGRFAAKGIEENPLDEQGGHKAELVQRLELAVQNGDVHILMDGSDEAQTLIFQMNDYTETKTRSGNPRYANSQMPHDDCVSALYAAWADYSIVDAPIAYCGLMGAV